MWHKHEPSSFPGLFSYMSSTHARRGAPNLAGLSRLLVLSASYGEGHQQAANAIRDAVQQQSPNTQVEIIDFMKSVHPVLDSVVKYCYLKSVRFAPALYGWFYYGTSQIAPSSLIQRQLNSLGIENLAEILEEYQPDVVLATFPTPAGVVSYLKQQGRTNVPLATVITDHAIHSQWIHPLTNMYFVGSEHVRKGLIARGIDSRTIRITGIPVRPSFLESLDKGALRAKYGMALNVPTVLVMGGAYGVMGDLLQICEELFQYPHPIQVIVVTGRNLRLKAQLDNAVKRATRPVSIFGFVSEVHELMSISDLVVTKAGGLTISEALALQLPMLLYRPIPGQEVQNANFLVNQGVAVLAHSRREVSIHLLELLVNNPCRLRAMREKAQGVRKLQSAQEIAEGLIQIADGQAIGSSPYLYKWSSTKQ